MRNALALVLLSYLLVVGHAFAQLGRAAEHSQRKDEGLSGTWYVAPETRSLNQELRLQFPYLNTRTLRIINPGKPTRRVSFDKPLKQWQINRLLTRFSIIPLEPLLAIEATPEGYVFTYGCSIRTIPYEDVLPVQSTYNPLTATILIEVVEGGFIVETIRADGRVAVERFLVVGDKLYQSLWVDGGVQPTDLVIVREYTRDLGKESQVR